MIGIVAFLNIAVVLGLAPTTGLPLPFLSYGGSSMMVNLGGVGILLSIASRSHGKRRWVVK
jgi:cell division protein FtsW